MPGYSATRYVTDNIEVMVRTGPGMDHKIIAMPRSGTRIEVLEELPTGWLRVRLPDERVGWMVGRLLTPDRPTAALFSETKSENARLNKKLEMLTEENARLKQEQENLQSALSDQTKTAEGLKQSYEALKEKDPEFLNLKASHDKVSERLAKSARREEVLEKKLEDVESGYYLKWFLAGAGVLLVGFLIGFQTRRSRRRPSLL
jgi:SH3 domain protein